MRVQSEPPFIAALALAALLGAGCLDLTAPQNTLQFDFGGDQNNATPGACTADAQCPVQQVCQSGACVAGCRTSADCREGELCIGEPRQCTVGGECVRDADCPAALPRCHPTLLLCVSCFLALDCPEGEVCNIDPACAEGGRECRAEDFTCGGCTRDDQCAPAACDLDTGQCVECADDAGCPEGLFCDTERSRCTGCATDAHCAESPIGPACLLDDAGGRCVPCVTDAHCGDEGTCDRNTLTCAGCRADADCRGGDLRCNLSTGLCYDLACTFDDAPALLELALEATLPAPWLNGPPVVAPLIDGNNDGVRDSRDPAQLGAVMSPPTASGLAVRVTTLGDQTVWTTSAANGGALGLAFIDVDADGLPEAVAARAGRLALHDRAGSTLHTSGNLNPNLPTLADVDQDGFAEIIAGGALFSEIAERTWLGAAHRGGHSGLPGYGFAAALDALPGLEIIAGGTIYSPQGEVICESGEDGFAALADLDRDGSPEVVIASAGGALRAQRIDCTPLWGPTAPPGAEPAGGGPPVIVDLDRDGALDVLAVVGSSSVVALRADGALLWRAELVSAHPAAGVSAADLDGDGAVEVLVSDSEGLKLLRGADGALLTASPHGRSALPLAAPVVADVDVDGAAEVVIASKRAGADDALVVLGDVRDRWPRTRNLWSQHPWISVGVTDTLQAPAALPRWWTQGAGFGVQTTQGDARPAPNLIARVDASSYDTRECPDRFAFTLQLTNRGAALVEPGTRLRVGFPDSAAPPVLDSFIAEGLLPGQRRDVQLTLDDLRGPVTLQLSARRPEDDEAQLPECSLDDNVILLDDAGCPDPF